MCMSQILEGVAWMFSYAMVLVYRGFMTRAAHMCRCDTLLTKFQLVYVTLKERSDLIENDLLITEEEGDVDEPPTELEEAKVV